MLKRLVTISGGHFDPYLKEFAASSTAAVSWSKSTWAHSDRRSRRIIVTVIFWDSRPLEQKRKLAERVTRYAVEKVGLGEDDVMLLMLPVPLANMSFGRGTLIWDMDLPGSNRPTNAVCLRYGPKEFLMQPVLTWQAHQRWAVIDPAQRSAEFSLS